MSSCIGRSCIGLDFGTTNTVLVSRGPGGGARPAVFNYAGQEFTAFRSALSFWREEDGDGQHRR